MQRKYFFFDIDGTLTDIRSGKIVPSAKEAVRKLAEAGHFVSICTGRAFYKAEPFRAANEISNMVCNGGHGIVIDGRLIENRPMPYEASLAVYREALSLGYGVLTAVDDTAKVYAKDFTFYDQVGIRQEPTVYVIDEHFDPENFGKIYKMYVSIPEEEEERLSLRDTLGHMRFVKDYLMFQPDEKKDGIFRMLELNGGKIEDVVVFGDDTNDMVMFDPRFYKVAMGNGRDELKALADYVAPANVEDGIYRACAKHGWF
ncbi:MAG: Cof-type HAD-IIB family hydrolase [Lachnospiraceae bacterium]|nr:Cof-type HAD-IIB family hydrolase [Lachnospiraceae bacterium]